MFTRRRQHKVPSGGYRSPLHLLIDHAEIQVKVMGIMREPGAPWIAGAELWLKLQSSCRPLGPHETPEVVVEERLANRGLRCRWEGDDLVVELPGWTPSAPIIVAIQPGLFD